MLGHITPTVAARLVPVGGTRRLILARSTRQSRAGDVFLGGDFPAGGLAPRGLNSISKAEEKNV